MRDLEYNRLIAVATLGGNSSTYFAESKMEQDRVKRGKGRLKRLENHAEEVRLEMQGPNQVVVEHSPEIKETCLRVVKQLQVEEAQIVDEWEPPTEPQAALRCWQDFDARKQNGEQLPEKQEHWWLSWQNNPICKAWLSLQGRASQ